MFSAQSRAARDTQEKGKREKKKGKRGEKLKIFVASVEKGKRGEKLKIFVASVAGSSSTAQAPQGLLPGTPKTRRLLIFHSGHGGQHP